MTMCSRKNCRPRSYRIDLFLNRTGMEPVLIGSYDSDSYHDAYIPAVHFARGYLCGMLGWNSNDAYLSNDRHSRFNEPTQDWDVMYKGDYHPGLSFTTKIVYLDELTLDSADKKE